MCKSITRELSAMPRIGQEGGRARRLGLHKQTAVEETIHLLSGSTLDQHSDQRLVANFCMRRSTSETVEVARWGDGLAGRILLGEIDPERVIRVLEPYASDRRRDRLKGVFANRLWCVTLVLDALHDPHNGAALLRTSDAFGLARVHVVERGESFLAHASVSRGTHKWVQVVAHSSASACVQSLRESGHVLVATHPEGELLPSELHAIPRLALVMGNEHEGIAKELRAACAHAVRVPMCGFAESLNVSVSGGILLSHATAGRAGDLSPTEQRQLYARGLAVSVPNAAALLQASVAT